MLGFHQVKTCLTERTVTTNIALKYFDARVSWLLGELLSQGQPKGLQNLLVQLGGCTLTFLNTK